MSSKIIEPIDLSAQNYFPYFNPTPFHVNLAQLFLARKYKDLVCVPVSEIYPCSTLRKSVRWGHNIYGPTLSWTCLRNGEYERTLYQNPRFPHDLNCCLNSGKRFICIVLITSFVDKCSSLTDKVVASASSINEILSPHANILIFDQKTRQVERYEPYFGSKDLPHYFEQDHLDKVLNDWTSDLGFHYIPPSELGLGHQFLQKSPSSHSSLKGPGDCTFWSIYWAHLRLANPDVPRNELLAYSTSRISSIGFNKFITAYKSFLTEEQTRLLESLSLLEDRYIWWYSKRPLAYKNTDSDLGKFIGKYGQTVLKKSDYTLLFVCILQEESDTIAVYFANEKTVVKIEDIVDGTLGLIDLEKYGEILNEYAFSLWKEYYANCQ